MTELQQKYCNARVTYYGCGGHKKAARNEAAMHQFEEQLRQYGEEIPSPDKAFKAGVFNGPGAS